MADTLTPDTYMKRAPLSPDEYMRSAESGIEHPALAEAGLYQPPEAADKFRYYLGRHLANALPAALATAGTRFGVRGAMGGAAAGSYGANAARSFFPRLFGSPSDTPHQDAVLDTVGQGVLPEILGSVGSKVTQGAMDFAQGGLPGLAHSIMSSKVVSRFSPSIRRAMESDRVDIQAGKVNEFLKPPDTLPESNYRPGSVRGPSGTFQPNPSTFAKEYNSQQAQGHQELTDLIHEGFSPSSGVLNPTKILDKLAKSPNEFSNVDPITRNNLKEFLTAAQKEKPYTKNTENNVVEYDKKRILFYLPSMVAGGLGVATGHGVGTAVSAGAAGTLVLGEKVISRLLENPETAALVVKAIKTPSTAPEATFVGALLKHALRGTEVILSTPDEKNQKAIVGEDGKLQYPPPERR